VAARLAEQYLLRGRAKDARPLVNAVLEKQPKHPLAAYVSARLLIAAGDEDKARKLLEDAVDAKAPEPKVVQLLGKMYYEGKDFAQAAKMFELGRQAEPYESKWLSELVRVYAQSGDRDKQINALKELVPTDADDLETRKRLTRLLLEEKQYADAERYAHQALEIDVRDAEAQDSLFKALEGQKKDAEAQEMRKLLAK
jgi:Tfp pilus assembly protein PilF